MENILLYMNYLQKGTKYYAKNYEMADRDPFDIEKLPENWISNYDDSSNWKFYISRNKDIQEQGWKIHISANLDDAQEILNIVGKLLIEKDIPFKHVPDRKSLLIKNSKNGNRIDSGKFITIYPSDDEFVNLLKLLYERLESFEKGPYILSDRCWKNSNIYYRYGAFKSMYSDEGVLCIKDDKGKLVPDNRTPYYRVPEFVKEPKDIRDSNIDKRETNKEQGKKGLESGLQKYKIEVSLRFNNGGGIYLAKLKDKDIKVIIKEARPKVGLDGNEKDSVYRIKVEYDALNKLREVDGIVNILDYFKVWEHLFLVEEYIDGISLMQWVTTNYPFHVSHDQNSYSSKVIKIISDLKEIVISMHNRNIGMGDLQPSNIMLNDDLEITLIDFESAGELRKDEDASMVTLGFENELNKNREERDWYSLKKTLEYCVLPIGPIQSLSEDIVGFHKMWIKDKFGKKFFEFMKEIELECDEHLSLAKEKHFNEKFYRENRWNENDIDRLIEGLRKGIISNCTTRDSLISGDIRQFELVGGKFNVLTGGFGAVLSLLRTGELTQNIYNWIDNYNNNNLGIGLDQGLFTGKAGIASVLYEAGYKTEALEMFNNFNDNYETNDISLRSGLSGIGLALVHLYEDTKDERYLKEIEIISNHIKKYLEEDASIIVKDWSAVPIGLIDGWSGASMLFTAMYRITNNRTWAELSIQALKRDLSKCKEQDDSKILQVLDDKNRLLPYISGGSIGLAIAIWYMRKIIDDELFTREMKLILNTNLLGCFYSAGLFDGAGSTLIIPSMTSDERYLKNEKGVNLAIDRLNLYLIEENNKIFCPGNFSYRLSSDLYSGSAGILLTLAGIKQKDPMYWMPLIKVN